MYKRWSIRNGYSPEPYIKTHARHIRTVQERVRAIENSSPFKQYDGDNNQELTVANTEDDTDNTYYENMEEQNTSDETNQTEDEMDDHNHNEGNAMAEDEADMDRTTIITGI